MQRRNFLKSSATIIGTVPYMNIPELKLFNTPFLMNDEVFKTNIGKIRCTVFRDLMFKYQAKDYFINASAEELEPALHKFHITPDNIPDRKSVV